MNRRRDSPECPPAVVAIPAKGTVALRDRARSQPPALPKNVPEERLPHANAWLESKAVDLVQVGQVAKHPSNLLESFVPVCEDVDHVIGVRGLNGKRFKKVNGVCSRRYWRFVRASRSGLLSCCRPTDATGA
jgi:hypothetical protein